MKRYRESLINLSVLQMLILVLLNSCNLSQKSDPYSRTMQHVRNEYPKVLPDNRVIFKLKAPVADNVQLDFGKIYDMDRDEDGNWTITSEPRLTGLHYYWYIIDGMRVSDPESEAFYNDRMQFMSGVEIPGEGDSLYRIKDVPHGNIRTEYYFSKTANGWRQLNVYAPPGYDKDSESRYPVLYLQHGGGENEWGWVIQGRANIVMDNLLAGGNAVPMLVVMANGHIGREIDAPRGYSDEAIQVFSDEMINDIIPFIESNYRVISDRKGRALAGLSMGGGQSFYTGLRNLEVFGSVGTFSSGIFGGISGAAQEFDAEAQIPGILTNPQFFNENLDVFYISVGDTDPRVESTKNTVNKFRTHGLEVVFETFPGDHDFQVWRYSLYNFAFRLFQHQEHHKASPI